MAMQVEVKRTFNTPVDKLFRYCSSPAFFSHTGVKPMAGTLDVRAGGQWRYHFDNGATSWGEYRVVAPNERLQFTWSTTHPSAPCTDTLVTMTFRAIDEKSSELTLRHEGFKDEKARSAHEGGWTDVFDELSEAMRGALGAALASGMELRYEIKRTVKAPVAKVFDAFIEPATISKFFVKSTSGPLQAGAVVEWTFDCESTKLARVLCREVVANQRLKFSWGESTVQIDFAAVGAGETSILLACSGWAPTQASLIDSYSECEGWTAVLCSLQALLEHGIVL